MQKPIRCLFILAAILSGCASQAPVEWQAYGGSRADATVEIGYAYNPIVQVPVVDDGLADQLAAERCLAWGYDRAEAFGGQIKQCLEVGTDLLFAGQCLDQRVTRTYQCLGDGGRMDRGPTAK